MQFQGEANAPLTIEASISFILKTTVSGSGVSMAPILASESFRFETTPVGGLPMRSKLAFTSSDVSVVPSWNLTLGRSLKVKVSWSGDALQLSATSGTTFGYFPVSKRSRVE